MWAARLRRISDSLDNVVALKMLRPELSENLAFQQMFLDEARIASRVQHPNVCATYELVELDGILTIAMEWVDGPSLMRVLRPGSEEGADETPIPIRPRLAARILAEACAGLHAAHELVDDGGQALEVVHRDVSPHNILLTSSGHVKLTDFGVAKALGKSHMTIAGQIKGKLAYMSPEQLTGGAIDRRSDVFALGCVLYEITTGRKPFQGEHDPQVMAAIMLGRYDPPGKVTDAYPPELEEIVLRALANEPDDRFASADLMRESLESYLKATGPPVMSMQIATLLKERCSELLDDRSRVVGGDSGNGPRPARAITGESVPDDAGRHILGDGAGLNGSGAGLGAVALDSKIRRPAAPTTLWFLSAALLGASLGVGVLAYVHGRHKPPPPNETTSLELVDSPIPLPDPASLERPTGRVRLHVTPANAVILLDGVVLPRGTSTLMRPEDSGKMVVLLRAEHHEDATVTIDSSTPDEVTIALLPALGGPRRTAHAVDAGERDSAAPPPSASSAPVSSAATTTALPKAEPRDAAAEALPTLPL